MSFIENGFVLCLKKHHLIAFKNFDNNPPSVILYGCIWLTTEFKKKSKIIGTYQSTARMCGFLKMLWYLYAF